MYRRIIAVTVFAIALASPVRAQLTVVDQGNLTQAVLIAERALGAVKSANERPTLRPNGVLG